MCKARNGYQLQRGVPKDVQPVIGQTIWIEGAGSTYRVAQRLLLVFAAKTDRLIAEARNQVSLMQDERIDVVLGRFDLSVAIAKEAGFSVSVDELKKAIESVELSEEHLEGISGGVSM